MDDISNIRTLLHIAREALAYHINEAEQRHEKERLIRPDRDIVARIDAALAEPVADDFKRGAEAMREAAAHRIMEIYEGCLPPDPWVIIEDIKVLAGEIRVMPVPEDKS